MEIDRDGAEPIYLQIAADLRARIASGELSGRMPAETALAESYDVVVQTVRKALAVLRAEGLIVTSPGWGSTVVNRH